MKTFKKHKMNSRNNFFFYLYPCCIPVIGYKRAIIIDTQRNDFIICPLHIATFLSKKSLSINTKGIPNEILEFLDELVEIEYGFYSGIRLNILPVSKKRFSGNPLYNSIIDFNKDSKFNWKKFVDLIDKNGCTALKIRHFDSINFNKIVALLNRLNDSTIRHIELSFNYNKYITQQNIFKELTKYIKLNKILIYNSENVTSQTVAHVKIFYLKEKIVDEAYCGFVSPAFFTTNIKFVNESRNVNNCLFNKLSIDKNGYVKTCPSSNNIICHIDEIDKFPVIDIIKNLPEAAVTKGNITVCKDCEFRLICHDCRVYTQKNNLFSKPLKCNYDPYTNTWN